MALEGILMLLVTFSVTLHMIVVVVVLLLLKFAEVVLAGKSSTIDELFTTVSLAAEGFSEESVVDPASFSTRLDPNEFPAKMVDTFTVKFVDILVVDKVVDMLVVVKLFVGEGSTAADDILAVVFSRLNGSHVLLLVGLLLLLLLSGARVEIAPLIGISVTPPIPIPAAIVSSIDAAVSNAQSQR